MFPFQLHQAIQCLFFRTGRKHVTQKQRPQGRSKSMLLFGLKGGRGKKEGDRRISLRVLPRWPNRRRSGHGSAAKQMRDKLGIQARPLLSGFDGHSVEDRRDQDLFHLSVTSEFHTHTQRRGKGIRQNGDESPFDPRVLGVMEQGEFQQIRSSGADPQQREAQSVRETGVAEVGREHLPYLVLVFVTFLHQEALTPEAGQVLLCWVPFVRRTGGQGGSQRSDRMEIERERETVSPAQMLPCSVGGKVIKGPRRGGGGRRGGGRRFLTTVLLLEFQVTGRKVEKWEGEKAFLSFSLFQICKTSSLPSPRRGRTKAVPDPL
mmetsp:Transcript_21051/g.54467  ORF Transcript_21051/g.54467 Transcript_21051/m.54467 type:complete len:319 (-) Transcript_21051:8662-9618(-)